MACVTGFHDACALRGRRWGRWDGWYGFNESRPRDFGERSRGVGLCLVQVSALVSLEDPCGGRIVCHGCALSIGHPFCPSPFVVPSFVPFGAALCQRCMHRGAVQMFLIDTVSVHFLRPIVARVSWSSVDNSCTCVTGVNAGSIQCCGNSLAEPEMQ